MFAQSTSPAQQGGRGLGALPPHPLHHHPPEAGAPARQRLPHLAVIVALSDQAAERRAAEPVPSRCDGRRAPTMAASTPGWASVHATASCGSEMARACASPFNLSTTSRFRRKVSPEKSGLLLLQSSAENVDCGVIVPV